MRALFLLLVIGSALAGGSYAGARFTAGKMLGPRPTALGPLTTRFAFKGIPNLPSKPRAWILAYPEARSFGRGGAEIYVSVKGELLGTKPRDLAAQLEAQRPVEP
ncbi:MAG TPA: hypothetical protein VFO71_00985 [Gemmatimonadales bacterium]|nr:hypothetical protein [Gemmatimonadales bacterium]